MTTPTDKGIGALRDLAKRYRDFTSDPEQDRRRELWRRHNSLKPGRPLVHVRASCFWEMPESRQTVCEDPELRNIEWSLRAMLYNTSLNDDTIFEPWISVGAVHTCYGWGVEIPHHRSGEARGSYKLDYPIKSPEDLAKLRKPWHGIDEAATAQRAAKIQDAIGDILPVFVDRKPAYYMWTADLSTELGRLRGIEHFMLDMSDNPEWLKRLVGFLADGVEAAQSQAEAAGDWSLANHQNQVMTYSQELADPNPAVTGVTRKQLWGFMAAQEFTCVGPAMHEEFLLRFQLPILSKYGLAAYGCCEDLTHKIDMLRQIPNLRRIAVTPVADPKRCAEQIGGDYVASWRPSPADMVAWGFDPDRIRRITRQALEAFQANGCQVDITLKDVETVQCDPARVPGWVRTTKEVIDEMWG